jgi:hypothetical protein
MDTIEFWDVLGVAIRQSGVEGRFASRVARRLSLRCLDPESPYVDRISPWERLRKLVTTHAPQWHGKIALNTPMVASTVDGPQLWEVVTTPKPAKQSMRFGGGGSNLDWLESLRLQLQGAIQFASANESDYLLFCVARVIEDEVWQARRGSVRYRWGLESKLDDRMLHRVRMIRTDPALVRLSDQYMLSELIAPGYMGKKLTEQSSRELDAFERKWVHSERLAQMLEWLRDRKTDRDQHIRWFIGYDDAGEAVLRAHGTAGYWIVYHDGRTTLREFAISALLAEAREGCVTFNWRASAGGELDQPLDLGPLAVARTISRADAPTCTLRISISEASFYCNGLVLRTIAINPAGGELIQCMEMVQRLRDADCTLDIESVTGTPLGEALAALLDVTSTPNVQSNNRKVRLVYLIDGASHPIGGVPQVGMWFVADALERHGYKVDRLVLSRESFESRIPELLGAEYLGFSVNLANADAVAWAVQRIRTHGFEGHIILGGPQAVEIDELQQLEGWNAIIRGEAEDVMAQVLAVLDLLSAGAFESALDLARKLRGVAFRLDKVTILCNTAERNRSSVIICPLPYNWAETSQGTLQMNFTRGCPYDCEFCPNHQGKKFHPSSSEVMWDFSLLALADRHELPVGFAATVAEWLNSLLPSTAKLLALDVKIFLVAELQVTVGDAHNLLAAIRSTEGLESLQFGSFYTVLDTIGPADCLPENYSTVLSRRQIREFLLRVKLVSFGSVYNKAPSARSVVARHPVTIETSEDNTLVNRNVITDYLNKCRKHGIFSFLTFNPGQNSINDFISGGHERMIEYISVLTRDNPCAIAFGVDGTCNPVLRQNLKPRYVIGDVLRVNAELRKRGVKVQNNYILLAPETRFDEAIEAFMLYLLLPIPWRDYVVGTNIRVIAESGTLTTDEARILFPQASRDANSWNVPFRDYRVELLLQRHGISSEATSGAALGPVLTQVLRYDNMARQAVPRVVRRWLDTEADAEILALATYLADEGTVARDSSKDYGDLILDRLTELARELATSWQVGRPITISEAVRPSLMR